jgi:hypothetical protein
MKYDKTNWGREALIILRDAAAFTVLMTVILCLAKSPADLELWRIIAIVSLLFVMKPFL